MGKEKKISFFKRLASDALPFVAKSPRMKVHWLVNELKGGRLTPDHIAPYISLMLTEYQSLSSMVYVENGEDEIYSKLFEKLDKKIIRSMIDCADVYDIPILLKLVPELDVEEAVIVLTKVPPPYERKPYIVVDKLFQAVYENSSEALLAKAADEIITKDLMSEEFEGSYSRFKEIREDEKVLSSLYPQASGRVRVE